jgi:CBS-domain-containing membrane protein
MNASDVMTREVVSITPETRVPEIVNLLLARGISGVPVVEPSGKVVGVVSEGDLLRRAELGTQKTRGSWTEFFTGTATLAEDYVRSHGAQASDVMSRDVISVTADTPLGKIADLMEGEHIRRVPVLDADGKLIGIISRSNLLRAFASLTSPDSATVGDDTAIREKLLGELSRQAWSRRAENSVVVTDGVVHLWGLVSTQEEMRALQLAAERVPGVKSVKNHLIVLSEEPYPLYPGSFVA